MSGERKIVKIVLTGGELQIESSQAGEFLERLLAVLRGHGGGICSDGKNYGFDASHLVGFQICNVSPQEELIEMMKRDLGGGDSWKGGEHE